MEPGPYIKSEKYRNVDLLQLMNNFVINRPVFENVIRAADLPAKMRFSEETLQGIIYSDKRLDQYFTVDMCRDKLPAEWLGEMKRLAVIASKV